MIKISAKILDQEQAELKMRQVKNNQRARKEKKRKVGFVSEDSEDDDGIQSFTSEDSKLGICSAREETETSEKRIEELDRIYLSVSIRDEGEGMTEELK